MQNNSLLRAGVVIVALVCMFELVDLNRQSLANDFDRKLFIELTDALEKHSELPNAWVHLKVTRSTQFSPYYVRKTFPPQAVDSLAKTSGHPTDKKVEQFEILVGDSKRLARIVPSTIREQKGKPQITAMNQDYGFSLIQSDGKASLLELIPRNNEFSKREDAQWLIRETFNMVSAQSGGLVDYKFSLLDWMNDPELDFSPRNIRRIEVENRSLVKLEFEVTKDYGGSPPTRRLFRCYSIHDPDLEWAIVEFNRQSFDFESKKLASTIRQLYKHHVLNNGAVIVASMVFELRLADEPEDSKSHIIHTFDIQDDSIDPTVFQLSHYGLPEPKLGRDSRWWLIGLAGITLIGLAYLAKRKFPYSPV